MEGLPSIAGTQKIEQLINNLISSLFNFHYKAYKERACTRYECTRIEKHKSKTVHCLSISRAAMGLLSEAKYMQDVYNDILA